MIILKPFPAIFLSRSNLEIRVKLNFERFIEFVCNHNHFDSYMQLFLRPPFYCTPPQQCPTDAEKNVTGVHICHHIVKRVTKI